MFESGESAAAIVEREGLKTISDTGALEKIVDEVIAANPKQVEQYKGGKTTVIGLSGRPGDEGLARPGQSRHGERITENETGLKEKTMLKEGDQGPRHSKC